MLDYDHLQRLLQNLADAETAVEEYLGDHVDVPIGASGGAASHVLLGEAKRTLYESHSRYTYLVSRIAAVILELDPDGVIRFANNAIQKATGYSPEELVGRPLADLLSSSDGDQVAELESLWSVGDVVDHELEMTAKNGRQVFLEISSANLRVDGRLKRILLFAIDVTARKRAEIEQRRLSLDLSERVKELTALQYVTRLLLRSTDDLDYVASEIVGILPSAFRYPEHISTRVRLGDHEASSGAFEATPWTIRSEFQLEGATTAIIEVAYQSDPAPDENPFLPEEYRLLRSMADLLRVFLERRQTERALRESEQRFRELAETIHEAFWVTGRDYRNLQYVSPAYEQIWGRSRQSLYQDTESFLEAVHKDDAATLLEMLQKLADGSPAFCEYRVVMADGAVKWVRDRGFPVFDESGKVTRIVGVAKDVTDQKIAELKLRASEAKYRRLFDTDVIGIFEWDSSGTIYHANDAFLNLVGYTRGDVEAGRLNWLEMTTERSAAADAQAMEQVQTIGAALPFEKEFMHKGGFAVPVLVGVAAFDESKTRGVAFVLDQREKQEAQRLLVEQKETLQVIVDNIPTMIAMIDHDGNLTFVNKEWERRLGWSLQESCQQEMFEKLYPDEFYREWVRSFIDAATGQWGDFQTRCKNGDVLDTTWCTLRLSDGTTISFGQDISERKSYERQITQANEALHALIDASPLGIFSYDETGKVMIWNRAAEAIFGWTREEVIGKTIPNYLLGEWQSLEELLEQEQQGRFTVEVERKRRRKDGTLVDVSISTAVLRQPGDTPRGVLKVVADITERRRHEEKLCLLEAAVEQANDSIVITDSDLVDGGPRIVFVNPAFTRMTGYTSEEVLGKTPNLLYGPKTDKDVIRRQRQELLSGRTSAGENVNYGKNGEEFINNWQIAPIRHRGVTTHFVAIQRDVTEHRSAEAALRESEERFRELIQHIPQIFWMSDASFEKMLYVSPMYEQVWGRPVEELYQDPMTFFPFLHPDDREGVREMMAKLREGLPWEQTFRLVREDGDVRQIRAVARPVKGPDGRVLRLAGIVEDVTEFVTLQSQFLQAQKMEAVGKLAGGVAHDFNNILTGIIGYIHLLKQRDLDEAICRDLSQIHELAERATALTGQLLLFSRKQAMVMTCFDLNELVEVDARLLARFIGEDVILECHPSKEPLPISADRNQIEQVLWNLAVNARDAMPLGGRLIIETSTCELTDADGVKPGPYAVLRVSDDGCGMTKETQAQIFEPFFTTKERGRGTGLGLATVYGVVTEHGGIVRVESEIGQGSTFEIILPTVSRNVARQEISNPARLSLRGSEGILLVEDEDAVRTLMNRVLDAYGYSVLAAACPAEAAAIFVDDPDRIELLVTDVVMPGIDGRQLYDRLCQCKPGLKVIYMSGYTDSVVVTRGVFDKETHFIQKPFEPDDLVRMIRRVLDE